jgi:hypothetical protein
MRALCQGSIHAGIRGSGEAGDIMVEEGEKSVMRTGFIVKCSGISRHSILWVIVRSLNFDIGPGIKLSG